jgi:hypothetical protein
MQAPELAVQELRRCVQVGTLELVNQLAIPG